MFQFQFYFIDSNPQGSKANPTLTPSLKEKQPSTMHTAQQHMQEKKNETNMNNEYNTVT
jgi:hypothetical protein